MKKAKDDVRRDSEWFPSFTEASSLIRTQNTKTVSSSKIDEGYYGLPLLKKPKWRWEVALYFFLEGISSGAFLIASLVALFGRRRHQDLIRAGYYTAFAALVPCPPLLIADLGRPERFHHMLRVFKPSSPMNLGAWTLLAYSVPTTFLAGRELIANGTNNNLATSLIPLKPLAVAGLPLALTLTSYPGVLLSTTSTPVWSRSRFLGALMACASVKNALAACNLHLELHGGDQGSRRLLRRLESLAGVCEGAALATYVATSSNATKPLTSGRYRWHWAGAIGASIIASTLLRFSGRLNRKAATNLSIAGSALSLAGGLLLKWAITHAGRESSMDIAATHEASKATKGRHAWTGPEEQSDQSAVEIDR